MRGLPEHDGRSSSLDTFSTRTRQLCDHAARLGLRICLTAAPRLPLLCEVLAGANPAPDVGPARRMGGGRRVYLETYGCQMNVADSEVVRTLLYEDGLREAESAATADVVLLNTCAIRRPYSRRSPRLSHRAATSLSRPPTSTPTTPDSFASAIGEAITCPATSTSSIPGPFERLSNRPDFGRSRRNH